MWDIMKSPIPMEKGALDQVRKGITTYISKILAKIKSKNVSFSELLSILMRGLSNV